MHGNARELPSELSVTSKHTVITFNRLIKVLRDLSMHINNSDAVESFRVGG